MICLFVCLSRSVCIRHHAAGTVACTSTPKASLPVFQIQSSSLPVFQIQFQLESESGVGVWRPILENPFLGGVQGGPLRPSAKHPTPQEEPLAPKFAYLASSWRSCAPSWRQDATTCPKISKKHHLGANIFQQSSQNLPRQPPGPSRGGPNPQKTTKSDGGLIVFTLQPFFRRSQKK